MPFYTLKIGNVYLAQRRSILVRESRDFEQLVDGDNACGASCSLVKEREFTFGLEFLGSGSLAAAWSLANSISSELLLACTEDKRFYRRVQDETAIQYRIKKGSLRMTDTSGQFSCYRILAMELKLTLVNIGPQISPVIVNITIPKVTVNLADAYFV